MRRSIPALCLLGLLLLIAPPPAYAPTAVEYILAAGPLSVRFDGSESARVGLLVPAVQRAAVRLTFLHRGDVIFNTTMSLVEPTPTGFFDVFFDVSVDREAKLLTIKHGGSNVFVGEAPPGGSGEISVLIGLLLPAVQKVREAADHVTASLQLLDGDGSVRTALPFIHPRLSAGFAPR